MCSLQELLSLQTAKVLQLQWVHGRQLPSVCVFPILLALARGAEARLLVTRGHRVMVERRDRPQPLQAAAIKLGDHVLISGGGKEKLLKSELVTIRTVLVDLEVIPNEPLLAFPPLPEAIQSMGREQSRTRRGRKPAGNETESWEMVNHPNTDDGF